MKKISLVLTMVLFAVSFALAQRTISGTVTGGKGDALIGAAVLVKNTTIGTVTDVDGKYSLEVAKGANLLVVSFVGYETKEVVLGASNVVDVSLAEAASLTEVVVTAQGIKREKKSLGYASTTIAPSDIAGKPETDVARAIAGRTPGVTVASSSGLVGSGNKMTIRGISSVSGSTQPLWVVDGVPISTATNENNDFRDGNITPSRALDIDPNMIESISVLRGLSATTLYGSEGRNGVILVTTKGASTGAGTGKLEASLSQSYNVIEAIIPEYQNKWANGFDGDYGEFFSNWGSLFSNNSKVGRHPYYEWRNVFPQQTEFATATDYVPQAYPNNVKDFFKLGTSANTSVNLSMKTQNATFNANIGQLNEDGYITNNNMSRSNFNIGGSANLSKKFTVTGTFNFVRTDFKTPSVGAGTGSNSEGGASVFSNLFYTPRNMNLMGWPYQNPVTGASVYYRNNNSITNPRWLLDNSRQGSLTNRFFGMMSANYALTDWLRLTYRMGLDNYAENQEYYINKGAVGFPSTAAVLGTGLYRTTTGVGNITDHTAILTFNKELTQDFNLTANLGVSSRTDTYKQEGMESTNQVVFGLLSHRNFIDNNDVTFRGGNLAYQRKKVILGAFFDATAGYKNYLFLNLQGRQDQASTHEKEYRSQFYPGVSVSFIPTSAFPGLKSKVLDFVKLRAGYGTSARFADPYKTRPYLQLKSNATVDANGNVIALALPILLPNPVLKPELQIESEVGIEAQNYNKRFGFDLSFYNRIAKDQIIERKLDPSTGYTSTFINAGEISNKGIELSMNVIPVKTQDFSWMLRANFTKNISKVVAMPDGSKSFNISGFTDLGNFIEEGQPFGVIKGTYVNKHANGQLLINGNGDWDVSNEIGIIGDPNPKFLLSGATELKYKFLTLGAQLDYVHGGDVFSYSAATLVGRGVAKELENFNPQLPVIIPGVTADGNANTLPVPASRLFFANTIIGGGAKDRGIYDGTRLRLREVYLNVDVPQNWLPKGFIKGATVTFNANNMWFRAFNTPLYSKVDLDRTAFGADNGLGFDFLGGPSAKRYGLNMRLTF
jgi:TonB-linked SusC/RagA family outer membrane protein